MMDERRKHVLRLGAVVLGMFAFGFALGPLYTLVCEVTGINGKMKLEASTVGADGVDRSRTVTVEFVTTVNGGKPWAFRPEVARIRLHPGELTTVRFYAENTEQRDVVARAIPNVAPWKAASHLRKTECFCFEQQPLAAGEGKWMPVRFVLDPELPAEVDTVTLSYTMFDVTELAQQDAQEQTKPQS